MVKSYLAYITFTDSDGDFVVLRKSAIIDICQNRKTADVNIGVGEYYYTIPKTEFITFDSLIAEIFY